LQESGPTQVQLLTVLWIVGVSIAAWIIYAVVSWKRRRLNRPRDLGSVSDQWIAEYRAHQPPDQ